MSLWSRGWRSGPTSVLPLGMPLSPINRAAVVFFLELGFAVSFTICHLLIVSFSVTVAEETPIFVPLTLRGGVGRYRNVEYLWMETREQNGHKFKKNGHKLKDNIYRAYIGPYYRGINHVGPIYLFTFTWA